MGRDQVMRVLTLLSVIASGVFALFTLFLFIGAAIATDGMALTAAFIMAVLTGGTGVGAWFLSRPDDVGTGVGSPAERELLNHKQRSTLRKVRGEVLMERALADVENERQNIVHRALEAANDPNRPPHKTSFTEPMGPALQARERERRDEHGR